MTQRDFGGDDQDAESSGEEPAGSEEGVAADTENEQGIAR